VKKRNDFSETSEGLHFMGYYSNRLERYFWLPSKSLPYRSPTKCIFYTKRIGTPANFSINTGFIQVMCWTTTDFSVHNFVNVHTVSSFKYLENCQTVGKMNWAIKRVCLSSLQNVRLCRYTASSWRASPTLPDYNSTQDRQCTYGVILRCVRTTVFTVEDQWLLHVVSVCL
jgi:hypothetical protein